MTRLSAAEARDSTATSVWRRKLRLKAKIESGSSHFSFKRSVPGGFNVSFKGTTCAASPVTGCRPRG